MKTISTKTLFLPQLKLIAKTYGIDITNKHGYIAASRILFGKGLVLN